LHPGDLLRIEEFIEGSNKASSVDELFDLYRKAMANIGFDRLIFSLMTDHAHIHKRAGHGIMLNYPAEWMAHYLDNEYEIFDPVRCQMHAADNVFIWDDLLSKSPLTKKQVGCLQQAEDAGLKSGVGIPLRGPHGSIAGIGAASSSGGVDLDPNSLSYINLISHQFYTAFLALEKNSPADTVLLTEREREVLQWFAKGKTRWEVGEILGLSENTIAFHLRNSFEKLQCNNITLAVLKALYAGVIQL
jgi:DNA-binding CsgD family transcriptional regulator